MLNVERLYLRHRRVLCRGFNPGPFYNPGIGKVNAGIRNYMKNTVFMIIMFFCSLKHFNTQTKLKFIRENLIKPNSGLDLSSDPEIPGLRKWSRIGTPSSETNVLCEMLVLAVVRG